jgi:mono/diheme cytochrome c family protein
MSNEIVMENAEPMRRVIAIVAVCLLSFSASSQRALSADEPVQFENSVAKVLKIKCGDCHGPEDKEAKLDLTSAAGIVLGGENGKVLEPGTPNESSLFSRVLSGEMPPEGSPRLTKAEIQTIRDWIAGGAKFKTPPKIARPATQHDVIPILLLRCTACHGTRRKEGGLDLRTRESILKGGNKGPAAVAGKPAESLLIKRIHAEEMPPRRLLVSVSVKPMTPSELSTLERWIAAGLPTVNSDRHVTRPAPADRKFWSFQAPKAHLVPEVKRLVSNPIDAFVERKLNKNGLTLAAKADRLVLLRRVCIDLTGLPPTIKQQDDFLADTNPGAWKRLINQFLDSPRYGERWARHWLDAAGYADSEGAQNEDRVRSHIWRYRDYVVRAFNADKPYDRFLQEQIAGDELVDYENAKEITPEIYDCLVATGFLRTTPDRTFADITNFVPDRLEVIADEMQVFSSAVLGLTVQCARCHAHKFDPISQHDYYGLTAIFKDALDEHDWLKSQGPRTLNFVTTKERSGWEANEESVRKEVEALNKELEAKPDETKKKELEAAIKAAEARRKPEPRIRALWSRGEPSPSFLLLRGNYLTPGEPISPDVPAVLSPEGFSFQEAISENATGLSAAGSVSKKTGRRLALARWLTRPDHPLTARVIVNRVWKHHFGLGIVRTVDNFGVAGERPTHPQLLDWLATEFVKNGWSIKWLHRTILTSEAWQQTSRADGVESTNDAPLVWHMPLLRMDAEVIRDSLLSISGQLDVTPFGPPDAVELRGDGLVTAKRSDQGWRRSIFIQQRRTRIPTLLENFDFPQMGPNCLQRGESIVAPQALHLLNNKLVHDLAGHFAKRVREEAGEDSRKQIRHAWRLAIGQLPSAEEELLGNDLLAEFRQSWIEDGKVPEEEASQKALWSFCHAVMNSAAFLYID